MEKYLPFFPENADVSFLLSRFKRLSRERITLVKRTTRTENMDAEDQGDVKSELFRAHVAFFSSACDKNNNHASKKNKRRIESKRGVLTLRRTCSCCA